MLKYFYHLKRGWLREPLFSFFSPCYFYLHAFSLGSLQLFQFNSMTKMDKSILQSPVITSSICLAISSFSTQHWVTRVTECYIQHKKRHPDPSITRLLSTSPNSRAVNKFLVTQEHSFYIVLDSSQMWGPIWNSMPKSLLSPISLLGLLSLMDQCLTSSSSTFQIISSPKYQFWRLNSK